MHIRHARVTQSRNEKVGKRQRRDHAKPLGRKIGDFQQRRAEGHRDGGAIEDVNIECRE